MERLGEDLQFTFALNALFFWLSVHRCPPSPHLEVNAVQRVDTIVVDLLPPELLSALRFDNILPYIANIKHFLNIRVDIRFLRVSLLERLFQSLVVLVSGRDVEDGVHLRVAEQDVFVLGDQDAFVVHLQQVVEQVHDLLLLLELLELLSLTDVKGTR